MRNVNVINILIDDLVLNNSNYSCLSLHPISPVRLTIKLRDLFCGLLFAFGW